MIRPELIGLAEVAHGGANLAELRAFGIDPEAVIDLSVNSNPLGPAPTVVEAAGLAAVGKYPEVRANTLRAALGKSLGVTPAQIVCGNGAAELIWLAALATIGPGGKGAILGPTFGEYERAIRIGGGRVLQLNSAAPAFAPPVERFAALLERERPSVAFLANPNNPTGALLDGIDIERLLGASEDTLLVVDEAYLGFVDQPPDLLPLLVRGNLLLLRSMTKDQSIPGLRLGYGIWTEGGAEVLRAIAPPWNVNAAAIAAGLASLGCPEWSEQGREIAREQIERTARVLKKRGFEPVATRANFLIVYVGDSAGFRRGLLERGVQVRDCASFGLDGWIRISAGTPEAIDRLRDALPAAIGQL